MSTTASGVMPSAWAGGPWVCIPGIGTGRIVDEGPRVIEINLPAPECAVFLVNTPTRGTRAVVLTDPRAPWEHTMRTIAAARLLEESAAQTPAEMPTAVGDDTPPCGLPAITARPDLQVIRGGQAADTLCQTGR